MTRICLKRELSFSLKKRIRGGQGIFNRQALELFLAIVPLYDHLFLSASFAEHNTDLVGFLMAIGRNKDRTGFAS